MQLFQKIIKPNTLTNKKNIWVDNNIPFQKNWGFNNEWQDHINDNLTTTWELSAQQRFELFLPETQTTKPELQHLTLLDAGCGNGLLTLEFAKFAKLAVGIDLVPSLPQSTNNCFFVQGDFSQAPFLSKSFDIIVANGTIHHTPNTKNTFNALTKLVTDTGKMYVWVYYKPSGLFKKTLLTLADGCRFFVSRCPLLVQKIFVLFASSIFYVLSKVRKGANSKLNFAQIKTNVYDTFTPKYRSYHTIEEIKSWFLTNGFSKAILTSQPNGYGFGVLGIK
jgi:SAM-dependent methyltransferase